MIQPIRFSRAASALIGAASLVLAVLVGRTGFAMYRQAARTSAWPSVPGEILRARVDSESVETSEGTEYRYSTHIHYRYSVNGRAYVSNRISTAKEWDTLYSWSTGLPDAAHEGSWLAKYPVGKQVVVYYDPKDPSSPLLERDEYWLAFTLFALAAVAGLIGAAVLHAGLSRRDQIA